MPELAKGHGGVLASREDKLVSLLTRDFANLVIQPAEGFPYFYDTAERR